MLLSVSRIIVFLVFTIVYVKALKIPSSFTACRLKDQNFEKCLSSSIEEALKLLKPGLPELGIPTFDPADVKSLVIGEGSGAVHLVQNYADLKIHGLSDATVKHAHYDPAKKVLKFATLHPKLQQKANYDINGKIMVLPVYGKGYSVITLDNAVIDHEIHLEETKKNNKLYYSPKTYVAKISIGHAKYEFENLFDGNKAMADNVLGVINQEWKALFDDVKSGIETGYAAIFNSFAKRIFAKVPAEDIFLE